MLQDETSLWSNAGHEPQDLSKEIRTCLGRGRSRAQAGWGRRRVRPPRFGSHSIRTGAAIPFPPTLPG